ncbi:hypothetical protein [Litchfieldella rifensis]|uniref:Uncharacterized protein n=1 Tax=Litchfieldella rifensis TaxID=762643 RepID=A0ABV7LRK9_9GAMM
MPRYSFKIDPCPPEEGYGWVLRYFEDDWEIPSYEIFASPSEDAWIIQQEFENAQFTGELWVEEMIAEQGGDIGASPASGPSNTQLSFKPDE